MCDKNMDLVGCKVELCNEDGTEFKPPINPLYEEWLKKYPPVPKPELSQVCDGYSCEYCGRCPKGADWECPEEDLVVFTDYVIKYQEYYELHNPTNEGPIVKFIKENTDESV